MIGAIIIVWGTENVRSRRGVVVDVCPRCRRVALFLVTDHFTYSHLYGVPTHDPNFVGSSRQCGLCGLLFGFEEARYSDVISEADGQSRSFAEVFERTNPRKWRWVEVATALKNLAGEAPYRVPAGAGRLVEALDALEQRFLEGMDLDAVFERLSRWDALSPSERNELLDAILPPETPAGASADAPAG